MKRIGYCSAVIVAAGNSSRMRLPGESGGNDYNKIFLDLEGDPILAHTLTVFEMCGLIGEIVLVTRECDIADCKALCDDYGITKVKVIITGGQTRQESVRRGLSAVHDKAQLIAIHDAARCLVSKKDISDVVLAAAEYGAAVTGVPCKDSLIKTNEQDDIISTINRENVWQVQTPQVFNGDAIKKAHLLAEKESFFATDDCAVAELYGIPVKMVCGSYSNIKITTPEDMIFARGYLTDWE